MDECEDNLSAEDVQSEDSLLVVRSKSKKRSLIERELETSLTARVTSPVTAEGASTSRYGRARRSKIGFDIDSEKVMKPLKIDTKPQPQAYKMHASNSPIRKDPPKQLISIPASIEDQIENIYNENMSLSRFGSEELAKGKSPAKKFPKIYTRKDLIQKPDTDNVVLIKNLFSPAKSNSHLNNILERSSEKYSLNGHARSTNGFPDTSSVVKTLDFDGKKKKNDVKEKAVPKNELFDLEASCKYQVGDLAWARVGTYPFWPCIVTREPFTDMFVKKKLFGRVEHDVIHVTFFGDNGRRGWIVDNMMRKYSGLAEFESAREKFTPEAKKKDPRLYAAHFVSEKKLPLWNVSVEEAETLMREPKRLRIDILYDMLEKVKPSKTAPKREKGGKITRTDSDVSLSESLYDTLFSEDDGKVDENNRTKRQRNQSLDVSEVVTACLDNMAAKSGIIKIQKQSHMDRWLQKAKSKTPEKSQPKFSHKTESEKRDRKRKKSKESRKSKSRKNESLNSDTNLLPYQNEHDYSSVNYENHDINDSSNIKTDFEESGYNETLDSSELGIIAKVETIASSTDECSQDDIITTVVSDDIVMTDAESIPKENNVVDANDDDNIMTKDETTATCVQNSISSIEEIKDKQSPNVEVSKSDSIKIRRSKRKQQSVRDQNNSKVENTIMDDCSQDGITRLVNDNIDVTGAESMSKELEVIGANGSDKLKSEDDMNVTHIQNSISLIGSELEKIKENNDISKSDVQIRRSKRKQQSLGELNNSHVDNTIMDGCSQDVITRLVNDNIDVTGAESISKNVEVVGTNDNDKLIAEDDMNVTHIQNSISLIGSELEKIKENNDISKSDVQIRRSKRKQQTLGELNNSHVDNTIMDGCSQDVITRLVNDNIDVTGAESISKNVEVVGTNDNDKLITEDDMNETYGQNSISLIGNELEKIEDKPPQNNDISKSDVQIRRSKRKQQSLGELNNSNVDNTIMDGCSQDVITRLVNDNIDVTGAESISKKVEVVGTNDNDELIAEDDMNETYGQNRISSIENEPEKIKDKPPQNKEISKSDVQIRRSKRKRQSAGEKNNCIVGNKIKKAKLVLVESNTEISINSNNLTDNSDDSRISDSMERKDIIEEPIVPRDRMAPDIDKTYSVRRDEWYNTNMMPLNGPKPVVVIEPLRMIGLGTTLMAKETPQLKTDVRIENELIENCDSIEKPDIAVIENKSEVDSKVLNEIELVSENKVNNKATNDGTVGIPDGSITNQNMYENRKKCEDAVTQNKIISNVINSLKDNTKSDKMDVDDHEIFNNTKDNKNLKTLELTIQSESKEVMETLRTENNKAPLKPENKEDTAKVVVGEETYIFERSLSQDYDEIFENDNSEINSLPVFSETKVDYDCNDKETKNGFSNSDVLSQDYDKINNSKDEYDETEIKVKQTESSNVSSEKNMNVASHNDVVSENTFFEEVGAHKDKDKTLQNEDDTHCLTNDKHSSTSNGQEKVDEIVETESDITDIFEDKIPNVKKLKSPKLSLNRTKKVVTKVDIEHSESDTKKLKHDSVSVDINKDADNLTNDVKIDKDVDSTVDVNNEPSETVDDAMVVSSTIDDKADVVKVNGAVESKESSPESKVKEEFDPETASIKSEDSGVSLSRRKIRSKEKQSVKKAMDDPDFIKYLELRQDSLIDEQPELTQDEIVTYLYQTWLYEESNKSDRKKTDDVEQSNLVKGLNQEPAPQPKKIKKKPKVDKEPNLDIRDMMPKEKPKRKITQTKPYYNEEFSDLEEEDLETFSIFDTEVKNEDGEPIDEVELYFERLAQPKPNVFKGYIRERVCEICERTENLVKCKRCHGMFHVDCVNKVEEIVEVPAPTRGRKKKKKPRGRPPKGYQDSLADSESQSDDKSQDANVSEELNESLEEELESRITIDAEYFESQWEMKMKELLPDNAEDLISDQEIVWDAPPGHCEIIDVKHKEKPVDHSDFKCKNCQKYDTPVCFVCKSDKSPKGETEVRQKCQVAHCHRYYHLECLEYWPQTQFNSWEPSKSNKKPTEYIEALSCPRHVCHTCVSDDPRGCRTRFCGDKLARCVRCPATYHSFTRCLPAGSQILTASQIICPRHYEHRPGKVPCHVNTGWCFICALGGTLICCEYCPTSFHAECLNIKPPEGSYMCEDCETGRLPLYGEMVWVKLGHYRWWPGIILHPTEIPDNIMAVKHSPGEFVVRFFGQYDHYWVNRGRVFPFQEGDSGKISSQKSKIDAAFTTAMEHAQRACEILKNVQPNEEEDMDIASSLLPPHYVKLKVNKPVGGLAARRDDAHSLTQCDCDPDAPDPCGPYSHCLNRMLLTECGPACRAGERCNNRAFERRSYPRLAAARAPPRGWGLRALEDIRQGQFVIEYVGELIDEEEFRRRMCRMHEIRDENYYFLTLDKERMIDAGPKGNLARFMNHCCEPNCETQKWTVLGDVRVGLFALRDIPANSELTFNYNLECAGIEKKRCLCGAKRCSGYIGAKPKQEEAQPKKLKLKGPGKRTYKKRKNVEDSPSTSKIKPPVKTKTRTVKPRELTEIEKDLLIIKNATNGMSSDSEGSRLSSVDEKKDTKSIKRKRVSFSTDEVSSSVKKARVEDKVGD